MTRNEVILVLMRAGLYRGAWTLDDELYDPMSPEFIAAAWRVWTDSLPPELKQQVDIGGGKTESFPRWLAESGDCDNIAVDFAVFLDRCMAVDAVRTKRPRGNAASGRLNFLLGGTAPHCVNWFIDYDSTAHIVDAGNGLIRALTPVELPTITCGESC